MLVLSINSGSSSLKCAVIDPKTEETLFSAQVERLGSSSATLAIERSTKQAPRPLGSTDHTGALEFVLSELRNQPQLWEQLGGVGHRVVHGGEHFTTSALITDDVIAAIQNCIPLAPLHNPANLMGIEAARQALSQLSHVAVFDTAFHQTMPEVAYRYALPNSWYDEHRIRRYGFHGTSHRFVVQRAAQWLKKPIETLNFISAHLGNGCSAAAVKEGRCVDTTMGLTPLEGLVMGTRSGDIDPAIIFYLKESGLPLTTIEQALNGESGLLGLSGLSNDMRVLTEQAPHHAGARLAIEVFCHRLAKYIGALSTNFDQLDALIFTGGIGEHSALVRQKVCNQLGILGIVIDATKNQQNDFVISKSSSHCAVLVVPTNEELLIARDTLELTKNHPS